MKLKAVDVSLKSKKGLEEVICFGPLQFLAWLGAYIMVDDNKMLQCKTKKIVSY